MRCRHCNSNNTRTTVTEHHGNETWRYCKCLDCNARFKTIEVYAIKKSGTTRGTKIRFTTAKCGEQSHFSVLTEKNVRDIRLLADQHFTYQQIAQRFGIHKDTVYRIVKRKSWVHV